MVHALVNLNDDTNKALNVVKAKHGLKDKGTAIEFVVRKYLEEPEVRSEFVALMQSEEKRSSIKVKDFAARYGL